MNPESSIKAAVVGPVVWIQVTGRGSFQNSAGVKELAAKMAENGHTEFVIDLKDCELMDSTFMGTLAGIALRLGDKGRVRVVRANPRNRQVLANLGLDRILHLEDTLSTTATPPPPEGTPTQTLPVKTGRDTIVEAHENLVAANPENVVRFKDVLDFLKQKEPGKEGGG